MFRNEHKTVIYNTLNSAYLVCPNDAVVEQILEQWENAGNGYGAVLAEKDLENSGKRLCKYCQRIFCR